MERLTKRTEFEEAYIPHCGGRLCDENCANCDFDTKLIEKLAEYEDAEEQGLLLRLPCKVGDVVYDIARECGFEVGEERMWVESTKFSVRLLEHIGKDVFLTRAEAEKALEEMGKV